MVFKILQWNINGFINNYLELVLLIRDYQPDLLSIQETHIPFNNSNTIVPKTYCSYFHNLSINKSSKQGVGGVVK